MNEFCVLTYLLKNVETAQHLLIRVRATCTPCDVQMPRQREPEGWGGFPKGIMGFFPMEERGPWEVGGWR